jgi:excinuclease ABC subunit C
LAQYYSTDYVPLEIHVPADFEDRETLEKALTERRGRRVRIFDPKRGQKREMITLVENNAKIAFEQRFRVLQPESQKVLGDLQEILELPHFPARIESFDISNISGSENVAGIVVFENGKPNRAEFRRFIIRTVEGADDYASMHEAVFRRYKRLLNEEKPLPQLIFIDGGKGQINAAAAALGSLDLEAITIVGLVKPPKKHSEISHLLRFGYEDKPIYFEMGVPSVPPRPANPRLNTQDGNRISPQTPRNARFYKRINRIEGVAEKRKMKLLRNFGSIERIAKASIEELTPFLGAKTAKQVFDHFDRQRKLSPNREN